MTLSTKSALVLAWSLEMVFCCGQIVFAADCNGNGIDDAMDIPQVGFSLSQARTIPVQSAVHFVTATDLNADGRPDLITNQNERVSVLLQGDLADFPSMASFAVGGNFGESGDPLKVADLDGDGDPDLATSEGYRAGSVWVLLNKGDGHYREASHYPTRSVTPTFLIATDLDGDGALDLATPNQGWNEKKYGDGPELSVLRNLGDGTFSPGVGYQSGVTSNGADFVLASDFNEDGRLDLAVSVYAPWNPATGFTGNGRVAVFLNDGQGGFLPSRNQEVGPKPGRLIPADFDADGHLDLVTRGDGHLDPRGTAVLLGDGTGAFPRVSTYNGMIPDVAIDLDGDGSLDLAGNCGQAEIAQGRFCLLFGSGGGQFSEGGVVPMDDALFSGPAIALDLNGDGRSELVAPSCARNSVRCVLNVLLNSGARTFTPKSFPISERTGLLMVRSVNAADLNNDGRLDLLTAAFGSGDPNVPGGSVSLLFNFPEVSTSRDINHNGIPDECDTGFHRGDPDLSGEADISDAIAIFVHLFLGNPVTLSCLESADTNNDGAIDSSDGIYLLSWLFNGGPDPAVPGPTGRPCGVDPDAAGSKGDLGCESYTACR